VSLVNARFRPIADLCAVSNGLTMHVIGSASLAMVAACSQVPRNQAPVPQELSPQWLIGAWVPVGESCESDAGVRYSANGTWAAYDEAGTWQIRGVTLIQTVTERGINGAEKPFRVAERHTQRISVTGPDTYQARFKAGLVKMRRCLTDRR
jgi:hypothetical protein